MKTTTRSASRALARRATASFRLELETLENRLLPGNTLALVLTGGALLGASSRLGQEQGSVREVVLVRHQDSASRAASAGRVFWQDRSGAVSGSVSIPSGRGSQQGTAPVREGNGVLDQGRISWAGEDDLMDALSQGVAQGKPSRTLGPNPAAPVSRRGEGGEGAAPVTAPRTGRDSDQATAGGAVGTGASLERPTLDDALAVFLAGQVTSAHRGGNNPPPPDPPPTAVPGLYNTGVDNSSHLLPDAATDSHYSGAGSTVVDSDRYPLLGPNWLYCSRAKMRPFLDSCFWL